MKRKVSNATSYWVNSRQRLIIPFAYLEFAGCRADVAGVFIIYFLSCLERLLLSNKVVASEAQPASTA